MSTKTWPCNINTFSGSVKIKLSVKYFDIFLLSLKALIVSTNNLCLRLEIGKKVKPYTPMTMYMCYIKVVYKGVHISRTQLLLVYSDDFSDQCPHGGEDLTIPDCTTEDCTEAGHVCTEPDNVCCPEPGRSLSFCRLI